TAQDFYAGRVLAALGPVYPPGYPLLIAAVFPFVGHWELAGQLFSGSRGLMAHCAVLDLFRITEAQRPLRIPGVGTDSYLGAILKEHGDFVVGVEQDAILADRARGSIGTYFTSLISRIAVPILDGTPLSATPRAQLH